MLLRKPKIGSWYSLPAFISLFALAGFSYAADLNNPVLTKPSQNTLNRKHLNPPIHTIHFQGVSSATELLALTQTANAFLQANPNLTIADPQFSELLTQLTVQLRNQHYPIAQVVMLPLNAQSQAALQTQGAITLHVFLGQVGKISIDNNSTVASTFLNASFEDALCDTVDAVQVGSALSDASTSNSQSCVLTTRKLERAVALTKLIPGVYDAGVTLTPQGVGPGQTQAVVTVNGPQTNYRGFVTADNYGIPSTGVGRLGATFGGTSILRDGDSLDANLYVTAQNYWAGLLDWNQPIGYSGMRFGTQLSQMQFVSALGGNNVNGTAQSIMLGLSDPLVFHFDQVQRLQLSAGYTKSTSSVAGISYQDRKIPFITAGISGNTGLRPANNYQEPFYAWAAQVTYGKVSDSAPNAEQIYAATSQILGDFAKLNAQVQARQPLGDTAYYVGLNLRGQGASRNLDPSLMMAFGGIDGVRAYPITQGSFTNGAIASLDLKRNFVLNESTTLVLGAFTDYVTASIYRYTWSGWNSANPSLGNSVHLSGYGLSADLYYKKLSASIALANRYGFSAAPVGSTGGFDGRIWAVGRWAF